VNTDRERFVVLPAGADTVAHRDFFAEHGDARQVWARERSTGRVVFLPDGEADRFRAACNAGQLLCPIPGCDSPAFRARGAEILRHHFAHREATASHAPHEVWRVEALAAVRGWLTDRWPSLRVTPVGGDALELTSPRTGRRVVLAMTARRITVDAWRERRRDAESRGATWQVLLAPTSGVVRMVEDLGDAAFATRLWGVVAEIVARTGAAVALNPQAQLVGTMTSSELADAAGLAGAGAGAGDGRLIVEPLTACDLTFEGLVPPAAAAVRAAASECETIQRTPRRPHAIAQRTAAPAEQLPAVAPGVVATEGMDDLTRWAIFQQAMRGKPRPD
jgi:hypothetical protein